MGIGLGGLSIGHLIEVVIWTGLTVCILLKSQLPSHYRVTYRPKAIINKTKDVPKKYKTNEVMIWKELKKQIENEDIHLIMLLLDDKSMMIKPGLLYEHRRVNIIYSHRYFIFYYYHLFSPSVLNL